ncbi:hypothetical protein TVAG_203660 [Trichomonas vaginalis G3]|uniref:Uncharacterized protein n=1 Tax=Trichomonas vaginalis (strain ATCC PRA-98 / G3) TaxID=412133 RepID=A2ETE2_TRIV3|nr:hypothetical protein TVAGG3_0108950 [Trichomonas vaginalis G3]EAY04062.1 hypothetical protein TVAG_203660 [Trichomonas vaginalis G3]KAI5544844.1 hypothetical protein TVAGG3_0108950 [Trichomonas vaginalis G3]|eukprot:XP_001316285.1 hypothetical protein [Trichomonas vaginalis G3]
MRNPVLDIRSSIQLLRMAFRINVQFYLAIVNNQMSDGVNQIDQRREPSSNYFFAPKDGLEKVIATILAMYTELSNNSHLNFMRMAS